MFPTRATWFMVLHPSSFQWPGTFLRPVSQGGDSDEVKPSGADPSVHGGQDSGLTQGAALVFRAFSSATLTYHESASAHLALVQRLHLAFDLLEETSRGDEVARRLDVSGQRAVLLQPR